MDKLISDLRELEVRIIIMRYKGIRPKVKVAETYKAPELPLETEEDTQDVVETDPESIAERLTVDSDGSEEVLEEVAPNQISLIDSIEEIDKETSINERMQKKHKKSVAQRLQTKPLVSITKALNLNQKMGLINQVFSGDEAKFKSVLESINSAPNLDEAQAIWNSSVTEIQRKKLAIVRKLDSLIERRFS